MLYIILLRTRRIYFLRLVQFNGLRARTVAPNKTPHLIPARFGALNSHTQIHPHTTTLNETLQYVVPVAFCAYFMLGDANSSVVTGQSVPIIGSRLARTRQQRSHFMSSHKSAATLTKCLWCDGDTAERRHFYNPQTTRRRHRPRVTLIN